MKSKVASGKTQWFKGQISNYDELTWKYGIYFPCDDELCMCIQMTSLFANCITGIIVILFHQHNEILCVSI